MNIDKKNLLGEELQLSADVCECVCVFHSNSRLVLLDHSPQQKDNALCRSDPM